MFKELSSFLFNTIHYFCVDSLMFFPLILLTLCVEIGIGYKTIVKLKFCAQSMHQIYVMKYCILLKNKFIRIRMSYQAQYGFHDDSFQV